MTYEDTQEQAAGEKDQDLKPRVVTEEHCHEKHDYTSPNHAGCEEDSDPVVHS